MNYQQQIDTYGYYIKNTFICTPDELFSKLKKSKSETDLDYNTDINDFINRYTPNIDIYSKLLYKYITKFLTETINETLNNWLYNIYDIYESNYNVYNSDLKILEDKHYMFNSISEIFMDKKNHKKNIIALIIQLKNKINDKLNSEQNIFIDFLEKKLQELFNDKNKLINFNNSNIKHKLTEQINISKKLEDINKLFLIPQLEKNNKDKEELKDKINKLKNSFISFNKLIDKQIYNFLSNYDTQVSNLIKKEWDIILKTKQVKLDFDSMLILGNEDWGIIKINISFPEIFEFKIIL